jgi:hypothetical protein
MGLGHLVLTCGPPGGIKAIAMTNWFQSVQTLLKARPPAASYEVGDFTAKDAPGVVQLFRDAFGDAYPLAMMTDAAQLIRENRAGRALSTVARSSKGEVAGHAAFYQSAPCDRLLEWGALLISPAPGVPEDLASRILDHGIERASRSSRILGVFAETMAHLPELQAAFLRRGLKPTALAVDSTPAPIPEEEPDEDPGPDRVSTVLAFRCFQPGDHQTVYLPYLYRNEMQTLYEGFEAERTFVWAKKPGYQGEQTRARLVVFADAGVGRIVADRMGADFEMVLARLQAQALEKRLVVIQLWLPLNTPDTVAAIEAARFDGYFLGGLLPNWFRTDAILLQRVLGAPDWNWNQMPDAAGKLLAELVRDDWRRVS